MRVRILETLGTLALTGDADAYWRRWRLLLENSPLFTQVREGFSVRGWGSFTSLPLVQDDMSRGRRGQRDVWREVLETPQQGVSTDTGDTLLTGDAPLILGVWLASNVVVGLRSTI